MPDKDCTCLFREEAALWRNLAKSFATYQTSEAFPYYPNARQPRRTVGLCGTLAGMLEPRVGIFINGDEDAGMRRLNGVTSAYVATMAHTRFKQHCVENAACRSSQYVFDNSPAGDDARSLFCLLMERAALDDSAQYAAERGAA